MKGISLILLKVCYSFKNLFYILSFGQRPRQCLNKSKKDMWQSWKIVNSML